VFGIGLNPNMFQYQYENELDLEVPYANNLVDVICSIGITLSRLQRQGKNLLLKYKISGVSDNEKTKATSTMPSPCCCNLQQRQQTLS
jgi:hypothetical protein